MCVAVPMELIEINYPSGIAESKGVKRQVGLQLLPEDEVKIGDYVIVHVGFAIEKMDKKQADEILNMLDEIIRLSELEEDSA